MPQSRSQLTSAHVQQLAVRWREYQESLTGCPTPPVPPRLQAIADRCDASLLLQVKPDLIPLPAKT